MSDKRPDFVLMARQLFEDNGDGDAPIDSTALAWFGERLYNAGRESMREELASVELQLAVEKTHVNLLKAGIEREESEVTALRASLQSMRDELKFCDAEKQSARRVSRKMIDERDEAARLLREFAYRTAETDLGLEDRAKAFLTRLVNP